MIFDFRVRLTPRPGALGRLLATMDAHGIARAALAAGGVLDLDRLSANLVYGGRADSGADDNSGVHADNDAVLDACSVAAGRLVPFYFANPYAGAEPYQERVLNFRGLELSPAVHGLGFTDPRMVALVRVAARAGHPVYVVCLGRPGTTTADLVRLATMFPEVTFVSGHCGFIGIDTHALNQIAPHPNIVVETSGCFTVVAELALARLGCRRVLFGTEFPLQHPSVELAKLACLDLAPRTWSQVAWRNAHRLLGEEIS